MTTIQNPFARLSDMIPLDEREAVVKAVTNTYRNTPTHEDMSTMFRVWNTYVSADEPQDMTCRGCRTRVVGKLREVVKLWSNGN